ncbi:ogr/Delta-like zinc finger family protein [Pseudomaricurvus alkylphenolicus]|uniref:ogr/Delta-like zinc finger family protein n=1 Tax=Pseudomaricurvus alkylphenolicus TaxID=1306991 RepID=UPI001421CF5E|nr:ogr/Delta-like zinc finger family protein [Pseudomaricurvus alkylphenolicus]
MLVTCTECGSKATISSRQTKDPKVSDLYCTCKNVHCGHTFVSTLSFSHTISPSAKQSKGMMIDMLMAMPKHEQQQLLRQADLL